jgi:putative transposase
LELALNNGVPRTTAIYWINNSKNIKEGLRKEQAYLEDEINKLNSKLVIERAKVQFISSLAQYLPVIKNGRKRIAKSIKSKVLKKIEEYKKYCQVSELLSLIGLHISRYYKWRSESQICEKTKKRECAVRRMNQLTGDEISRIIKLVSSKKYQHFSLTALWKFALRKSIVVCSKDTWFKYVNRNDLGRKPLRHKKIKYQDGLRADTPNSKWHLDLTEFKLLDGRKVYLQAIIDNFSRYIVDWEISTNKKATNTVHLIKRAKAKVSDMTKVDFIMDRGTENKNKEVEMIFIGNNIKQIFAQVDIKYSNSMVEAFFRSIKNNYLYKKTISTYCDFKRAVQFYITQHNNVIPHSSFTFATPKEKYLRIWSEKNEEAIQEIKKEAVFNRRERNLKIQRCNACLV